MTITEINIKNLTAESVFENSQSLELLSQFRNSETWFSKSDLIESMTELLGQHALPYFSPVKAAFLFQFKSIDSLSYYSPVLARDGALTLLHFFLNNPMPSDPGIKIIINKKLSKLVPTAWLKNILTFKISNIENAQPKKRESLILIASMFGSRQSTKNFGTKIIDQFLKNFGHKPKQIILISTASQTANDPHTQEQLLKTFSELLFELAKTGIDVVIKSLEEMKGENLSDLYFQDLNEFNFYYADSFIFHLLLSQGAKELLVDQEPSAAVLKIIPLSFNHQLEIEELKHETHANSISLDTFRNSPTLAAAEAAYSPEEVTFSNKICSKVFEGFAFDMAQKVQT